MTLCLILPNAAPFTGCFLFVCLLHGSPSASLDVLCCVVRITSPTTCSGSFKGFLLFFWLCDTKLLVVPGLIIFSLECTSPLVFLFFRCLFYSPLCFFFVLLTKWLRRILSSLLYLHYNLLEKSGRSPSALWLHCV